MPMSVGAGGCIHAEGFLVWRFCVKPKKRGLADVFGK